jgi:hypothetical protein
MTKRGPYKRPPTPAIHKHPSAPIKLVETKLGNSAPKRPKVGGDGKGIG